MDAFGEDPRAAVGLLIAVDACQYRVVQVHGLNALADAARLLGIERRRAAGLDFAEAAGACTGIPHEQEGGGAASPTFADIGAERLFADRIQTLSPKQPFEFVKAGRIRRADAQPGGTAPARKLARPAVICIGLQRRCAGSPVRRAGRFSAVGSRAGGNCWDRFDADRADFVFFDMQLYWFSLHRFSHLSIAGGCPPAQ